jgi:2-desacetyl-2-hydroxyethyl bacteriochlorophyllide A dehydrogenase
MKNSSLYFTGSRSVEIRENNLPSPPPGEVLVQTLFSAISPGSELLAYRGLFPQNLPVDETITSLKGPFSYPMKYGYSVVGKVISLGKNTSHEWEGRTVFSFHPHESHFLAAPSDLFPLPPDVTPEEALFLPNLETAVNFMMDGRPVIGEQVVVFGQGIVGLLTTALLSMHPLACLITLDMQPLRRKYSLMAGAHASLDSSEPGVISSLVDQLKSSEAREGADLVYEISGSPEALEQSIAVAGFHGRIVIGSWYGLKAVNLSLGGRFHRSRIRLISSQVSSINPKFLGRWTKSRRLEVAWSLLEKVQPVRYITHRFPFSRAAEAYNLLDRHPEESVQIIFSY